MSDERREHERLNTVHLVSYAEFNAMRLMKNLGMGATIDLSEGGILIWSAEALPVPSIIELEIAIKDEVIRVLGRVVHAEEEEEDQKYRLGIKFVEMEEDDRVKLKAFVEDKDKPE